MMGTGSFTDGFKATVCLAGMQGELHFVAGPWGRFSAGATCRLPCILSPAGFKRQQAMGRKSGLVQGHDAQDRKTSSRKPRG